jgi:putative ABC transport system substrate-binding protein
MNSRRKLVIALGAGALAAPFASFAQQPASRPGMFVFGLYPQAGSLMSYGANAEALRRRAAEYVGRILKGARPSDLPVARPTQV